VVPEGEGTAVLHIVWNHPPDEWFLKVKAQQFFTLLEPVRLTMYHHVLKLFKPDIIISVVYRTELG